jgi:hypothetical protein
MGTIHGIWAARRTVLSPGKPGTYDSCGQWLQHVEPARNAIPGFVHNEAACRYEVGQTHKSMSLALSSDYGLTSQDHGLIITGTDVPTATKITGSAAAMPTSAHRFSLDEVVQALLRDRGIHEGKCVLSMKFGTTGASISPQGNTDVSLPALVVSISAATLVLADDTSSAVVDAAVANPRKLSNKKASCALDKTKHTPAVNRSTVPSRHRDDAVDKPAYWRRPPIRV